jgi:hypothetical protein
MKQFNAHLIFLSIFLINFDELESEHAKIESVLYSVQIHVEITAANFPIVADSIAR